MLRIQFIVPPILLLIQLSCIKKTDRCETWEVQDSCTETGSCYYLGCNNRTGTFQKSFCGEGLKNGRAGNTIIIEGGCTTITRTFVRKL